MIETKIQKLVDELSNTKAPADTKNPWDFSCPGNVIRRKNLLGYFAKMRERKSRILLVGEAPGYRGCGRVGIPFSSERLLLSHPFFEDRALFNIENIDDIIAEASASIVWKTFDSLNFYPLMWATYPFHPHKHGDMLSNRAPRPDEIVLGRQFLKKITDLFNIEKIIAVGRVAERNLADMDMAAIPIRHPSHGGATMFAEGLRDFVDKNR